MDVFGFSYSPMLENQKTIFSTMCWSVSDSQIQKQQATTVAVRRCCRRSHAVVRTNALQHAGVCREKCAVLHYHREIPGFNYRHQTSECEHPLTECVDTHRYISFTGRVLPMLYPFYLLAYFWLQGTVLISQALNLVKTKTSTDPDYIFQTYLAEDSEYEITIKESTRAQVQRLLADSDPESFKAARAVSDQTLRFDTFNRYLGSDVYAEAWVASGRSWGHHLQQPSIRARIKSAFGNLALK